MIKTYEKLTEKDLQAEIIMTAADKIKHKALKTLASKGNPFATEFLMKPFHAIHDDLRSAVNVKIIENMDYIVFGIALTDNDVINNQIDKDFNFLGFIFCDYTVQYSAKHGEHITVSQAKKRIFQAVQNEIYKTCQKQYKREFIPIMREVDGEYIESEAIVTESLQEHLNSVKNQHIRELIEELREILTDKQREVLDLIIYGYKAVEIAEIMGISTSAIYEHKNAIKKKLIRLDIYE